MKRRVITYCILLAASLSIGCGDPDLPKMVKVYGKVTFNGGPPPAETTINFNPVEVSTKGAPTRPGTAKLDSDGSYKATSYNPGDGLIPGKYKINLQCWKVAPSMGKPGGVSYLPPNFQAPELIVDAAKGTQEFNIEAPIVQ